MNFFGESKMDEVERRVGPTHVPPSVIALYLDGAEFRHQSSHASCSPAAPANI